jgi:hypothetical protein
MTWRHHIDRTVTKALRTYVRTYSLFKSGRLSTNINLTLYKALIRSIFTYACPPWEHAADARLLKLQRLQNRVLRAVGNLESCISVRELQDRDGINPKHVNPNVRGTGQEEARIGKYNMAVIRPTTVQLTQSSCIS